MGRHSVVHRTTNEGNRRRYCAAHATGAAAPRRCAGIDCRAVIPQGGNLHIVSIRENYGAVGSHTVVGLAANEGIRR